MSNEQGVDSSENENSAASLEAVDLSVVNRKAESEIILIGLIGQIELLVGYIDEINSGQPAERLLESDVASDIKAAMELATKGREYFVEELNIHALFKS